jgi:hypothetical protein
MVALSVCQAQTDIEFVIDLSGSMQKKLGDARQVDHARKAFADAIKELPPNSMVAVRVFGHRVVQSDKEGSCRDTELLHPLETLKASEVTAKLAELEPKGYTPIGYSMEQAGKDFSEASKIREANRVIVLLSDGEETCGGDAVGVLKALKDRGISVVVHAIGFNVDETTRQQLQAIASFSGGRYFDATDASALKSALAAAAREAAALPVPTPRPTPAPELEKPEERLAGREVRGGDGYSTAVAYPALNTDLRLDHHQNHGKFDYFSLDLKAGDFLEGMIRTGTHGGHFTNGAFKESRGSPAGHISIHGPDQTKIEDSWLWTNDSNIKKTAQFVAPSDGRYFILVGATSFVMNKDHFVFNLKVSKKGDLDTDTDAGASMSSALPIAVGTYQKTSGGLADKEDWFKLSAKKGESYQLTMVPAGDSGPQVRVEVVDSLKIRVRSEFRGGDSGQGLKSSFSIPEDGEYFIKVRYDSYSGGVADYAVTLKKD